MKYNKYLCLGNSQIMHRTTFFWDKLGCIITIYTPCKGDVKFEGNEEFHPRILPEHVIAVI